MAPSGGRDSLGRLLCYQFCIICTVYDTHRLLLSSLNRLTWGEWLADGQTSNGMTPTAAGTAWPCLQTSLIVTITAKGVPATWQVEARDAAQCPTVHGTAPITGNDLGPSVNSTKGETPWCKGETRAWGQRVSHVSNTCQHPLQRLPQAMTSCWDVITLVGLYTV